MFNNIKCDYSGSIHTCWFLDLSSDGPDSICLYGRFESMSDSGNYGGSHTVEEV